MTSLSRQLKNLATPQSSLLDHKKKRASLLFSLEEASNYSRETYFKIGYSGFTELVEVNPQFIKFKETLYEKNSLGFQRTMQTKEDNKKLDKCIEDFLLLLSPFLQKHAALKALEWLIHRFLIHEMNVNAMMMCIMPYYESVIFVRILQLIDIRSDKSPWKWLHKAQISGLPIPKQTVFLHWISDSWFRNFISNFLLKMLKVHESEENLRIAVSYFISTELGAIISADKIKEDHVASIMQTFNLAFASSNTELISGMLLVIGQLSVKTTYLSSLTEEFLLKIAEVSRSELTESSVHCLITVCHYQHVVEFSSPVLKALNKNKKLLKQISKLAKEKAVGCFLAPYSAGVVNLLFKDEEWSSYSDTKKRTRIMALVDMIETVTLSPQDASRVIRKFMESLLERKEYLESMKKPIALSDIWIQLDKSHPEGCDKANISEFKSISEQISDEMMVDESVEKHSEKSLDFEEWLKTFQLGQWQANPKEVLSSCLKYLKNEVTLDEGKKSQAIWMISADGEDKFSMSLKALFRVLSVVVNIQMENSKASLTRSALKEIFQKKLGTLKDQMRFLSMFWGWHSDIPSDINVDPIMKLWCLNMAIALINSQKEAPSLSWLLAFEEGFVLSLIPPLCDEGFLSEASFLLLQELHSANGRRLKENDWSPLAGKFLACKEEILRDARCVTDLLKENEVVGTTLVDKLMESVLTDEVPAHVRCSALFLLSSVDREDIMKRLMPLASNLLSGAESLRANQRLEPLNSTLLYYILVRFSRNVFVEIDGGWTMFSRVMKLNQPVMQVTGTIYCPRDLVVNYEVLQKLSSSDKQLEILDVLIARAISSSNYSEAAQLKRELKKITLETSTLCSLLAKYDSQPKHKTLKEARAKKLLKISKDNDVGKSCSSGEANEAETRQKLSLVVELIGVMTELKEPWLLVSPLCYHLKLSLEQEADILQQQILSVLHHLLQSSSVLLSKSEFPSHVSESVVALTVESIRRSVNPDTHRRALLILALVANYFPEKVLHNIMAIFTFMGTSLLKRDDSYSFQVISQTVNAIVPTLIQAESSNPSSLLVKLSQVTQVFVDALPDLAEHRKLPLFTQLADTLGVSQYLWLVMVQIADALVMQNDNPSRMRGVPSNIQFALLLYSQFSVVDQLKASCEVLQFACSLPDNRDTVKNFPPKDPLILVINIEGHTSKQLRQLKHSCIGLLVQLLSSERFVGQIYELRMKNPDIDQLELRGYFEKLLKEAMKFVGSNKEQLPSRFSPDIQRKLMDLVNSINSLFPPATFLTVMSSLLSSDTRLIRSRSLEILASKLQPDLRFFSEDHVEDLTRLLKIVQSIGESEDEGEEIRQTALFTLQLLMRFLGAHVDYQMLMPVLVTASRLIQLEGISPKVETQAILVVAESVSVLKAHCLPHLRHLVRALLAILNEATEGAAADTRLVTAATALHKIIENVSQFLSTSQTKKIIETNCRLVAHLESHKESKVNNRLTSALDLLISKTEPRILVKVFSKVYDDVATSSFYALPTMMFLFEKFIASVKSDVIVMFKQDIVNLFTSALDIRSSKKRAVEEAEESVISALTRFLLKLNEDDNITIFSGFINWAWRDQQAHPGRLLTFFRFADALASKLKILFIKAKLADSVLEYAAKTLTNNNSIHSPSNTFGDGPVSEELSCILLNYTLDSLTNIFLYDSIKFTTAEKFNVIVTPLLDQIENVIGGEREYQARINDHLKPCIIKLTSAVADDSLWKELNRQLLLRMKSDYSSKIILSALNIFEGLIEVFGEDYLQPLLADIMPYITEVLESGDPEIESKTKLVFHKMETILGDNLRVYLDT